MCLPPLTLSPTLLFILLAVIFILKFFIFFKYEIRSMATLMKYIH